MQIKIGERRTACKIKLADFFILRYCAAKIDSCSRVR